MRQAVIVLIEIVVVIVVLELALTLVGVVGAVLAAAVLFGGALYVAGRGREQTLRRAMRRRRR